MIVFKNKKSPMLDRIVQKLENERIDDYEIVDDIPSGNISINGELNGTEVYLPEKLEYSQYDIDDFIRSLSPGLKTTSEMDRDIYRMKVKGRLTEPQYFKLVRFLISQGDFCSIINS